MLARYPRPFLCHNTTRRANRHVPFNPVCRFLQALGRYLLVSSCFSATGPPSCPHPPCSTSPCGGSCNNSPPYRILHGQTGVQLSPRGCLCTQFCFLSWKWQKREICRPLNSFQTLTSHVGCIFVDAERIKKKTKETVSSLTQPYVNTWILTGS